MPKVYCIHHWIDSTKKIKECTICGESWDPKKVKTPPQVPIGVLPNYAPHFSTPKDTDVLLRDVAQEKSKGVAVYCEHVWDDFGPGTMRCLRCRTIWKKFTGIVEPRVIIGHSELPSDSE